MSTRGQGASTDPTHLCVQERQCHFQSRDVRGDAFCCSCLGSYSLAFSVSLSLTVSLMLGVSLSVSPSLYLSSTLPVSLLACAGHMPTPFLQMDFPRLAVSQLLPWQPSVSLCEKLQPDPTWPSVQASTSLMCGQSGDRAPASQLATVSFLWPRNLCSKPGLQRLCRPAESGHLNN